LIFIGLIFGWKFESFNDGYFVFDTGNLKGGFSKELKPSKAGLGFSITVACIDGILDKKSFWWHHYQD
jgi:hypothetical protein